MKNYLAVLGLMAFAGASAFGSACAVGTNLIAGAPTTGLANPGGPGCSIATLNFTNFSYDLDEGTFQSGSPDVPVEFAGIVAGEVILEFNPNLSVGSDLLLEDQVTGGVLGVDLSFAGTSGTGSVSETVCTVFTATGICPGADIIASLGVSGSTVASASTGSACIGCTTSTAGGVAMVTFGGSLGSVWILKDIASGTSPFSDVEQSYLVPEPMTMSLMGAGLLALGFIGRRRAKK